MESVKKTESVLLRFKERDSFDEISSDTFHQLMEATGMSKTRLMHFALSKIRDSFIPAYEMDDGPITDKQIRMLNEITSLGDIPEDFFDEMI
ncbi:TPA: hypothetical protein PDH53_004173 [Morganella morganii]|nr:hypothetical protein [Morganella morganii]HDF2366528.1 hypothetical protein [Morganella morganii]